jgi:hypothetical protein
MLKKTERIRHILGFGLRPNPKIWHSLSLPPGVFRNLLDPVAWHVVCAQWAVFQRLPPREVTASESR